MILSLEQYKTLQTLLKVLKNHDKEVAVSMAENMLTELLKELK